MTKSEIVEALRCAADLCNRRDRSHLLCVVDAEQYLGVPSWTISTAVAIALDSLLSPNSPVATRHDLLEAAQRIEDGQ